MSLADRVAEQAAKVEAMGMRGVGGLAYHDQIQARAEYEQAIADLYALRRQLAEEAYVTLTEGKS